MTGLFSEFPKIIRNGTEITNLTARIDFFSEIKNNVAVYEFYIIKDGQKPEDVAYEKYNDPELYWILFFMNDIVDPYYDWPLSEKALREFIISKYGAENVYSVHHHETIEGNELGKGIKVNQGTPFSKEVSNYDYETAKNEEKRQIKILKRRYLEQVLIEYKNQF